MAVKDTEKNVKQSQKPGKGPKDNHVHAAELVDTSCGPITVVVKGDRSKPALFTYHDLGLNCLSNFKTFFNYPDMAEILENFCIFHINAPGQEVGASILSDEFCYPSMDGLAEQVIFSRFP